MSVKLCCICERENSKYKCPRCKQLYCSIPCCNKHKEHCIAENIVAISEENEDEVEKSKKSKVHEYEFPTEDTVPIDKLEKLRYSEEVKNCLKNPQVRDIIASVLKDKDPTKAIAKAMTESVFIELADACLKVVEPSDEEKPC